MKRYTKWSLFLRSIFVVSVFFVGGMPAMAADMYLSDNDISISVDETFKVKAYNYSGDLYVARNSNSRVASVKISGRTISIRGRDDGESTIKICEDEDTLSCDTIYVDVGRSSDSDDSWDIGISSLILPLSSSITISSSDSDDLYVAHNYDPNIVSVSYSSEPIGCTGTSHYSVLTGEYCFSSRNNDNTSITIFALSVGVDTLTICNNNRDECNRIDIAVTSPWQPNYQYYPYQYYPYY